MENAKRKGELDSEKNIHLFENRQLTVREYIAKISRGQDQGKLASEALDMTVEEALRAGRVGEVRTDRKITSVFL